MYHQNQISMRMTNYAIVNLILFGIVLLEVLFLIVLCCLNKQTIKKQPVDRWFLIQFIFLVPALCPSVDRFANCAVDSRSCRECETLSVCPISDLSVRDLLLFTSFISLYLCIYRVLCEQHCRVFMKHDVKRRDLLVGFGEYSQLSNLFAILYLAYSLFQFQNCAAFAWTRYSDSLFMFLP